MNIHAHIYIYIKRACTTARSWHETKQTRDVCTVCLQCIALLCTCTRTCACTCTRTRACTCTRTCACACTCTCTCACTCTRTGIDARMCVHWYVNRSLSPCASEFAASCVRIQCVCTSANLCFWGKLLVHVSRCTCTGHISISLSLSIYIDR